MPERYMNLPGYPRQKRFDPSEVEDVIRRKGTAIMEANTNKTKTCWLWTGRLSWQGYARVCFSVNKKRVQTHAHRIAWELAHGKSVPDGLVIDHLCRVRNCVNPDHLEAVTSKVNVLRGISPPAILARKTHCKYGHPLSGENLHIYGNGYRVCRTCGREWRRWHNEKKAKGALVTCPKCGDTLREAGLATHDRFRHQPNPPKVGRPSLLNSVKHDED